jgi:hypothetical protein
MIGGHGIDLQIKKKTLNHLKSLRRYENGRSEEIG